jgi:hypothetical protein
MKLFYKALLLSTVALFVGVGAAKADSGQLLYFDLTGPVNATFELSSKPVIASGNSDPDCGFTVTPVDLMINGVASSDFLAFYNTGCGGGLAGLSDDFNFDFSLYGATIYNGSAFHPTFSPTSPAGMNMTDGDSDSPTYNLTISPVATPEPSSLLLLGMVLLPLGIVVKRLL